MGGLYFKFSFSHWLLKFTVICLRNVMRIVVTLTRKTLINIVDLARIHLNVTKGLLKCFTTRLAEVLGKRWYLAGQFEIIGLFFLWSSFCSDQLKSLVYYPWLDKYYIYFFKPSNIRAVVSSLNTSFKPRWWNSLWDPIPLSLSQTLTANQNVKLFLRNVLSALSLWSD